MIWNNRICFILDLEKLNTYCERYIYELDVLEHLISECNIGLLHVNQEVLKKEIIPVCKELQTILNVHLPMWVSCNELMIRSLK